MYATVGIFSMNPALEAEQRRELHDRIIPLVRRQPEFVSGYWNHDPKTARSYAYLVWQTERAARSFSAGLGSSPRFGVTLESVTVLELVATTQAG